MKTVQSSPGDWSTQLTAVETASVVVAAVVVVVWLVAEAATDRHYGLVQAWYRVGMLQARLESQRAWPGVDGLLKIRLTHQQ